MTGSDDKKDKQQGTPPETRLYSTPGHDPNQTLDTGPAAALSDPNLAPLAERFELLQELGRGGMGVVYKARDNETGGIVAVKVLNPAIAGDPAMLERFKNELLLAHKITHKNVCRTHDLHRFGETSVIAMEFIEGETLRGLLAREQGVSLRYGLEVTRQICSGLKEAHAQGVVHRDLKPENLMVDRDGNLKIMDFGIARSLESSTTLTEGITGTPAYMAPEQAEGKEVDQRTDIYALGLVLYELFTGEAAFRGDTPIAVAHKQIHEEPPNPREAEPDLPPRIHRSILKCLEKNPKHRFQSVEDLEAALAEEETLIRADTSPAADPEPPPHLSVWGKFDWVLLALGAAGLLYFLSFRDTVFPSSQMKLEVDSITARREAEAIGTKLGRPFGQFRRAGLVFDILEYNAAVMSALATTEVPAERRELLRGIELPLFWKVSFTGASDSLILAEGGSVERFVLVDRTGKIRRLHNPHGQFSSYRVYKAPDTETRRRIARAAAETVCGPMPEGVVLVEMSGGPGGASYDVTWGGGPNKISVSLHEEKTTDVVCQSPPEISATIRSRWDTPGRVFQGMGLIVLLYLLGRVAFLFGMGESSRSGLLRKRGPLAGLVGLAGTGLFAVIFSPGVDSFTLRSEVVSYVVLLVLVGFAASGLLLVGLVTAEHHMRRWTPDHVASYCHLMAGRIFAASVGMAVVRGSLVGLVLAAVETLLVHLSLYVPFSRGKAGMLADPAAFGEALASVSPFLFVGAAALVNGIVITLLYIGLEWADAQKELKKIKSEKGKLAYKIFLPFGFGTMVFYWKAIFPFGFGQLTGADLWPVLGLGLLGIPVALVLTRYDLLTAIVAVVTAVIFIFNYPLLVILSEVGNAPQWGMFIGWGAVVTAGALVAFRKQFDRWRRLVAEDYK